LTSVVVSCPRRLIKFNATRAKREYSDEEREACRQRFREYVLNKDPLKAPSEVEKQDKLL